MKEIKLIIIFFLIMIMASCGDFPDVKDNYPSFKLVDEYSYHYVDDNYDKYVNVMTFDLYTGQYFENNVLIMVPPANQKPGYNNFVTINYTLEYKSTDMFNNTILEPFTHYQIKIYFYYNTEEDIELDDNLVIIQFNNYNEYLTYDEKGE